MREVPVTYSKWIDIMPVLDTGRAFITNQLVEIADGGTSLTTRRDNHQVNDADVVRLIDSVDDSVSHVIG